MIEEDARPAPAVAAVVMKIPPFWPADPEVWFAQVEAQFTTRGITAQKTRFDHVVASLGPEFATEVRDLILTPPSDTPYDTLKAQLIRRTAASEQRRLQQLLHAEDIGDRKPTQLLRRMQQLLGDKAGAADGSFLKQLFLQRLPANVRMVLASTSDTTGLEDLAQLADRVVEVSAPTVSAVASAPGFAEEMDQLRSEVASLTKLVQALSTPPYPQYRPPRRGRSPSPARQRRPADASLCWYHQQFGEAAKNCRPPCAMSTSGNKQARR